MADMRILNVKNRCTIQGYAWPAPKNKVYNTGIVMSRAWAGGRHD